MNRIAVFLVLASMGASSVFGQDAAPKSLTFDQAVQAAQTNRPLLEEAKANLSAAGSRVGQAQSEFLPTLDTSASWRRALPQQQQNSGTGYTEATPLDYWNLSVGAREVLWDFGKREKAVKLAESGVRSSDASLRQLTAELTYQTVGAFWSVVFLKEELASLEEQSKDLLQHLNAVQLRAGTGSGTKYDVLNTQVRVTSLEGQKIETTRLLKKQKLILAQLVGSSPAGCEVDGALGVRKTSRSLGDLADLALRTRAEIDAAQAKTEGAECALESSLAGWTPDLSASVATGFQNPLLTQENQDLGRPMFNGTLGLTLSLSGLNPAQIVGQTDEARHRLEAARQGLAWVKQDIVAQVSRAFEDYVSSLSAWENAREQSGQARQALEAAATQYDLGVISNDTYLNSHLEYEQARLSELQVLYGQMVSYFALTQEVGVAPNGL